METKELKKILECVNVLVKKNTGRQILNNFKLSQDQIFYSNLKTSVVFKGLVPGLENECLVDAKNMLNYSKKTKSSHVSFVQNEKTLLLKGNNSTLKLPSYSSSDYVDVPNVPQRTHLCTINSKNLQFALKRTAPFASNEKNKFGLECLQLSSDGVDLYLVGTDQICLKATKVNGYVAGEAFNVSLSPDQQDFLKVLTANYDREWNFDWVDKNHLYINSYDIGVFACQTSINFPNFRRAISTYTNLHSEKSTKEEWQNAIDELSAVYADGSRICADDGQLKISSALGEVSIKLKHGLAQTGINFLIMKNYIKTLDKKEETHIICENAKKPIIFIDDSGYFFMSPIV